MLYSTDEYTESSIFERVSVLADECKANIKAHSRRGSVRQREVASGWKITNTMTNIEILLC